jgi:hypothetical protein
MAITFGPTELRNAARMTYTWVDNLSQQVARTGRYREAAAELDQLLAATSRQAADLSWGTSAATSAKAPGLIRALNDVAIHAGTVDAATGAAKSRNAVDTLNAARRAHNEVQTTLIRNGWHPNGREPYWPSS